jgi:hypothetical protein
VQAILLFLILAALSPRLARVFGFFIVVPVLLVVALLILAAWPALHH